MATKSSKRTSKQALALCRKLFDEMGGDVVVENTSHGSPAWFVAKRSRDGTAAKGQKSAAFADNHHDDGRLALWCAATPAAQSLLVGDRPATFFVPPYVGPRGGIGVILDDIAADALRGILAA